MEDICTVPRLYGPGQPLIAQSDERSGLEKRKAALPIRKRGSGDRTRHPLRRRTNASKPILPIRIAAGSGTAVSMP